MIDSPDLPLVTLRDGHEGFIAQSLDAQAAALMRESRGRSNQGPHLADHRKRLRLRAHLLKSEAGHIRYQLRNKTRRDQRVARKEVTS